MQYCLVVALALCVPPLPTAVGQDAEVYLSDAYDGLAVACRQGWGKLGINTAVVPPDGRKASPLRLGETLFAKGLGHHAPGELVFELLEGEYTSFAAQVGVHWQGGGRGSVIFQVFVDGEKRFDSGWMTDSHPAQLVDVSLAGARELRLVASDAGDGISCDMADWVGARLIRDPNAIRFGTPEVRLCGAPAPEPSSAVGGVSLIANDTSPQVVSLGRRAFAVCVREGEDFEVRIPVANAQAGVAVEADVSLLTGSRAGVSLLFGDDSAAHELRHTGTTHLQASLKERSSDTAISLRVSSRDGEAVIRWRNMRFVDGDRDRFLSIMPRPSTQGDVPTPATARVAPGAGTDPDRVGLAHAGRDRHGARARHLRRGY